MTRRLARAHWGTKAALSLGVFAIAPSQAWAQAQPAPLPPLPSQEPQNVPAPQAPSPPQNPSDAQPYYAPQPTYAPPPPPLGQPYAPQTQPYPPPQPYYSPYYTPAPPPMGYVERPSEPATHAPRFSLWTGARLGYMGFGGAFYGGYNTPSGSEYTETTGNLVTSGPSLQFDVGVRLDRRYIPFVFYERDFVRPGRRFDGDSASAYSQFYGIGFRYTAGDANRAGFLSDLSIGYRTVAVTDSGMTYKMTAFELFRLGLGAEIRLSTLFVLSPLVSISTGYMSDTQGNVNFSAQGSAIDGVRSPPYTNGTSIGDQRGYLTVSLTCGAHFDLFGK